ncbi:hypothetical protein [Limosilactobacillus sp.]|jgi:outer membrane protein assembly factor BamD (BamD/ComL family)|uniref:hypothetical protein n=1 Tax=Limosilactobacillus sp. TaxID=2773925 RepID=UPI0025C2B0C9|nr:hypothetical protein [Limosilactobacillus sp.]MCH3921994.1 hypothetical protein [Limosilactobacillus sp.]MCH3928765.1 hypothetical protein [Limosilactobacillus sp.]
MSSKFKKVIVGTAALTMSVLLAACGSQQSTTTKSTSSSSSSAPQTAESESTKAYRSANKMIRNHDYQGAYDRLNAVNNGSTQTKNLSTDLKNYLNAQEAYNNGDYDGAAGNLKELKSTSPAMKNAYAALQDKITSAKKGSSSATSSSTGAVSSSAVAKSSTSTPAANAAVSSETSESVVNNFANKMGFDGAKGYEIIPVAKNGSVYQFEVRQNNEDNTVASMIGIYQYNSQTGAVSKLQ